MQPYRRHFQNLHKAADPWPHTLFVHTSDDKLLSHNLAVFEGGYLPRARSEAHAGDAANHPEEAWCQEATLHGARLTHTPLLAVN